MRFQIYNCANISHFLWSNHCSLSRLLLSISSQDNRAYVWINICLKFANLPFGENARKVSHLHLVCLRYVIYACIYLFPAATDCLQTAVVTGEGFPTKRYPYIWILNIDTNLMKTCSFLVLKRNLFTTRLI